MKILGLNINHADTSACLIVNGEIITAIEEERFVRIKHYAGLPVNSIEFCLQQSELEIKDIDFITVNYSPTSNFKQKTLYSIKNILSKSTLKKILNFKKKLFHTSDLDQYLKANKFKGEIINVEHHMSHIASSYFNSPFKKSAGLTIDGFGEMFRSLSYKNIKTSTLQSRAFAGVANGTFIFCLPGSPGACKDGWNFLIKDQLDSRTKPCNLVELMPRLNEE